MSKEPSSPKYKEMTSNLAIQIDKISSLNVAQLTFFVAREVIKEMTVLGSDVALDKALQQLDSKQQDTLMKVLYAAMATDSKNSSTYLKWHASLYAVGGAGCIMRVLTDRPMKVTV